MDDSPDREVRSVSKDELKAGVMARACHAITFLVGGLPGTPPADGPGTLGTGDPGSGSDATGAEPGGGVFDPEEPAHPDEGADGTSGTTAPEPPEPDTPGTTPEQPGPAPKIAGRIDAQLVSAAGAPQANLEVEFSLPDGTKRAGRTGKDGHFLVEQLPSEGECKLEVPDVPAPVGDTPAGAGRVRYQPGMSLAINSTPVVELAARVRRGKMSGIHFETNKTFLLPSAMAGMRQLASLYNSFGALSVLVTGHTDTVSDAAYNRGLSVERAESIAAYLTDDVDTWMKSYQPRPHSAAWGVREDQLMLATLPQGGTPFYGGTIDGKAGTGTSGAFKAFQASKGLPQSGKGDEATRRALIKDYMAIDGTSLPKDAKALTHGCGLTHLAEPTGPGVANQANRRVEMFLFEGDVAPAPQTPCPSGGCPEFAQWVAQSSLTVDLDQPPGRLAVTVTGGDGKPLDGAEVHAAGPTPQDAVSKGGAAGFDDLVPGHYKVIADLADFEAADAEVDVASGEQATAALQLKELPPMTIEKFGARAITPDEAKLLQAEA